VDHRAVISDAWFKTIEGLWQIEYLKKQNKKYLANPPHQIIQIKNIGPQGSQVLWKVGTRAQWIQLGPDSGNLGDRDEVDEVQVSVTTSELRADTYKSNITIVANVAEYYPILIPVIYTAPCRATSILGYPTSV
jgi:hypothetical protein